MSEALSTALALLIGLDSKLVEIVLLSLRVSLSAVAIAALLGLPLGAALARRGPLECGADAALGHAVLVADHDPRRIRARRRRSRRGDDRRRKHRRGDARDDHRHRARNQQG